jgi:vitamin B12 transporter
MQPLEATATGKASTEDDLGVRTPVCWQPRVESCLCKHARHHPLRGVTMTVCRTKHVARFITVVSVVLSCVSLTQAEVPQVTAPTPTVGDETIVIHHLDSAASRRNKALHDAPFISIINADAHRGEQQSVASALASAPSTQVNSLGGLGAFSSVSVRGASPGHTAVLVNGIPLSRLASVTADLGNYSLESFSSVELYRGALPLQLSGGGIGGAVNMVTRLGRSARGERIRFSLGGGSFGARNANVWHGDNYAHGRLASSTTVAYSAARGDFAVFSDNGTPLFADDDGLIRRAHNGFWSVDASTRVGAHDQTWSAGVRGVVKDQQLPGSIYYPAMQASLSTRNLIVDGSKHQASIVDNNPTWSADHKLFGTMEEQTYRDPVGEIGLGAQQRKYLVLAAGAQTQGSVAISDHSLTAVLQGQGEHFADHRVGDDIAPSTAGNRIGGAMAVGANIQVTSAVQLQPGLRIDLLRTSPPFDRNSGIANQLPVRNDLLPSPRASVIFSATDDIAIKGSAGWYARIPTATELFGDRGFIVGTPGLRPERGPATEIGAVWAPSKSIGVVDHILVEASGFANHSRDTIVYITQAGFVTRPINIGNTITGGAEFEASARLSKTISASANYTLMYSTQQNTDPSYNDKELPRRARHRGYARIEAAHAWRQFESSSFVDGSWQSRSFLDQGNLEQAPTRWLIGAGFRLAFAHGFAITAEIKNLTDNRIEHFTVDGGTGAMPTATAIVDVAGFPLPGRAIYARLEWSY